MGDGAETGVTTSQETQGPWQHDGSWKQHGKASREPPEGPSPAHTSVSDLRLQRRQRMLFRGP